MAADMAQQMRLSADAPHVEPLRRERWRAFPGDPRRFSVSSRGRIYDHKRGSLVPAWFTGVPLCEMVALAFGGPGPAGSVAVRLDAGELVSAKSVVWRSVGDLHSEPLPEPPATGNAVADKLAAARCRAGLSREVISDATGLAVNSVAEIESSRRRPGGQSVQRWLFVCGAMHLLNEVLAMRPAVTVPVRSQSRPARGSTGDPA